MRHTEPMDETAIVVRKDGVDSAPVEDDLVILDVAGNDYVALDPVGRRIWQALEEPRSVGDLCRGLEREYEGDATQIAHDVLAFLEELHAGGLVCVVGDDTQ